MILTTENVAILFGAIGVLAGAYERWRSGRRQEKTEKENSLLADAKLFKERSEAMQKLAEDNMALFQKEHEEHLITRTYWHDKATKDQAIMSELQARPDYTDLMNHMETQARLMTEVLTNLKSILIKINPHI